MIFVMLVLLKLREQELIFTVVYKYSTSSHLLVLITLRGNNMNNLTQIMNHQKPI